MDMLSWTSLNPTVKEVDTKKKFFGVYLYKIMINVPGCRLITESRTDGLSTIQERLDYRISLYKGSIHNKYRSWHYARELENNARADQIEYFIDIKNKYPTEIKIRVEEPTLTIYGKDLNLLYHIASGIYPERLEYVYKPRNQESEDALNNGEVITTKAAEYSHKIVLRDHVFNDIKMKYNIGDYLYNLGDEIQMTKSLKRNLTSNWSYFLGGYFYCKDDRTVTFINLICPNLVSGIYKLTEPTQ